MTIRRGRPRVNSAIQPISRMISPAARGAGQGGGGEALAFCRALHKPQQDPSHTGRRAGVQHPTVAAGLPRVRASHRVHLGRPALFARACSSLSHPLLWRAHH